MSSASRDTSRALGDAGADGMSGDAAAATRTMPCAAVRIKGCRGQATIEAAFAIPILMILILLLVQPGIILYDRIVMGSAAAEGCRLLSTSQGGEEQVCEDYIRRRLSAIPQVDQFHVHSGGCSWSIQLSGNEDSSEVSVSLTTEVKPLPLLDAGAAALGLTNGNGNFAIEVQTAMSTQPDWYLSSR